jgi:hypothetical protein
MTRKIFEDLIEFHIGTHVSLLDIMRHGNPDDNMAMYWLGKRFPEFYPEKTEEYNNLIKIDLELRNRHMKSDESSGMDNKKHDSTHCTICHELVDKRIVVDPNAILCIDCAQYTMRSMLEDIIEYHNGIEVSLLEIMCYGRPEIDQMRAEEKRREEMLAKSRTSNTIFDISDKRDEQEK